MCLCRNYGILELWYLFIDLFFYPALVSKWIFLDLVGGGLESVCTPLPECPPHLWWHGLGIVLSYWCGIIRGKKIIRGEDRINLMSWFDTGRQETTVKNKDFFFGGLILCRVLAPTKSFSVVVNSNFFRDATI